MKVGGKHIFPLLMLRQGIHRIGRLSLYRLSLRLLRLELRIAAPGFCHRFELLPYEDRIDRVIERESFTCRSAGGQKRQVGL